MLWLSCLLSLGFLALAAYLETRRYEINRYEVTLRKALPHPFRILHLSDLHFSKGNDALLRFFEGLAKETYDFIFITGDIFDSEKGIPASIEHFKRLKAKTGVFAVFGNHDYYDYRLTDIFTHFMNVFTHNFLYQNKPKNRQPIKHFEEALAQAGARLLKNETIEKKVGEVSILIHGLDDPTTGRANIREAMQNFEPSKVNILLTHTIDVFLDIGENEIDLSFSGHSHGGQIRLPGIRPLVTNTMLGAAYVSGLKALKGAFCSVSRGLGTSRFLPFRLLCPPEAVVLTVRGEALQTARESGMATGEKISG